MPRRPDLTGWKNIGAVGVVENMRARHAAYGLDLRCSFELPGMETGAVDADGLPLLELRLVEAEELERAWSGASGRYSWTGHLGDGQKLTLEAGRHGELRFAYGERALFLLHAHGELLDCAPLQTGLHWQQVLLTRVLPDVALARGYEALHSSALASPAGVVAIAAPSGTGKTTLALELLRRGWPLTCDDVLVLGAGPQPGSVLAHPGGPHMNVGDGPSTTAGLGKTLGILGGERWLAVATRTPSAAPVRMICLFERGPGLTLKAQPLASSPLPLAPYMLGLDNDTERERRRFSLYADMVENASLIHLTADPLTTPAQLADLLEQSLTESMLACAESVS